MSLGQVVDQHAAPLEAQLALVTLVDEAVVVGGRNLLVARETVTVANELRMWRAHNTLME